MIDDLGDPRRALCMENRPAPPDGAPPGQTTRFLFGPLVPEGTTRHVPIHAASFVVGRRCGAALCLPNRTVSSAHAVLIDTGSSLLLRDLGSTNGTYVNGQRISAPVELKADDLVHFADVPFRVLRQAGASSTATICEDVCDQALALVQFDRLMSEEAVVPNYQPIVELPDGQVVGYEVLARSRVPGLEAAGAMFSAAAQLNLQTRLSQMMRLKAVQETMSIPEPPHLFLNIHPAELIEPGLIESIESLRQLQPRQKITLEIHEAALANPQGMKQLRKRPRALDVGLAFDDFGAGQSRLLELSEVHPDYLKFDMSLIRAIDRASAAHVQMIAKLVAMVLEMGGVPLAEGIEEDAERITCTELGFTLAQGYFFGRPFPLFAEHARPS